DRPSGIGSPQKRIEGTGQTTIVSIVAIRRTIAPDFGRRFARWRSGNGQPPNVGRSTIHPPETWGKVWATFAALACLQFAIPLGPAGAGSPLPSQPMTEP